MRHSLVLLTVALTLASGCYLGRTAAKKRETYAINGVAIGLGGTLLLASVASAFSGGTACNGDCNGGIGLGGGDSSSGDLFLIGASIVQAAIVMDVITACLPTEPEPERAPTTAERGDAPRAVVTTPGLDPTSVGVR